VWDLTLENLESGMGGEAGLSSVVLRIIFGPELTNSMSSLSSRLSLKVDWVFTFACAAYNLVRMRNLSRATVQPG
jgi:hypothetical protein